MSVRKVKMSYILGLPSVDSDHYGIETGMVREVINELTSKIQSDYYLNLRRAMVNGDYPPIHLFTGCESEGYYNILLDPDLDDKTIMGNGHHRVRIAFDLGWESINATDNLNESGWM